MPNDTSIFLSIVSPVYAAEDIIDELVRQITEVLHSIKMSYEIILVEDGSPDASWDAIVRNCRKNAKVKGIKLSRNFGQHNAITAGLNAAMGTHVIVMDCDLQDNPKYIPDLLKKTNEGFDIVFTYAEARWHSGFRKLTSFFYNSLLRRIADRRGFVKHIGNYTLLSRKAVNAFLRFNDAERHYLMVLRWLGFDYTFLEVQHQARFAGESSYNFAKLLRLSLTGFTYQSSKLLNYMAFAGLMVQKIALIAALLLFFFHKGTDIRYLALLILFCTGCLLMASGVLGIYLGKVFNEVRHRPLYLVDKKVNFENGNSSQKPDGDE